MLICPDCASVLSGDTRSGWRCESCGWLARSQQGLPEFLSSRDRESPLFERYVENYESIATDDLTESIQDESYLRIQAERLLSYIGDVRGLRVCDVGVGQGNFLRLARASGAAEVVGIDIAALYLERLEVGDGDSLIVANVESLPFAEEFDVVVASDVIEHVLNLGDALLSIRRALRPGGRLAIRVPYKEDLNIYAQQRGMKYEMVHLRDFDKGSLKRQLRGADFEVERLHFDGFFPGRKRRYIASIPWIGSQFEKRMMRRHGGYWEVARIGSGLGRVLMAPVTVTALARRPARG